MLQDSVYVIGAGASFEVGLPVGDKLKDEIARILYMKFEYGTFKSGNYDLYQALRSHSSNEINDYLNECRHICENMPLAISIDNFIDTERGNDKLVLCGKMAIIDAILSAEKNSKLYFDKYKSERKINYSSLNQTWYLLFFRALTENCNAEDLPDRFSHVTLIIFNYDRCIEHFLINALMSYYRLTEEAASNIINKINIIHPYGTVGSLPWQKQTSPTVMEFGGDIHAHQLINYSQRIRTFTEGANSEQMNELRNSMANTKRLIFLGFAFHRLNMEFLLGGATERYRNSSQIDCFATAHGASKSDQSSISSSIGYLYTGELNINVEDTTCALLFSDYSRSLGYA